MELAHGPQLVSGWVRVKTWVGLAPKQGLWATPHATCSGCLQTSPSRSGTWVGVTEPWKPPLCVCKDFVFYLRRTFLCFITFVWNKKRFIWINNCINICWLVPSTVLSTLPLLNALVLTITLYNTCDYPHFMAKETWDTERLLLAPGDTADLRWWGDLFQQSTGVCNSGLSAVNKCPLCR